MSEVTTPADNSSGKTWAQAAGLPETSTRLDHLPPGLDFPDDFPEPICFDPKRKRLVYRGFMTSLSYRYLHGLSTDIAYIEALDLLFEESAYTLDRGRGLGRVWPWLLAASLLLSAMAFAWARLH
jgi:hypothetical protein